MSWRTELAEAGRVRDGTVVVVAVSPAFGQGVAQINVVLKALAKSSSDCIGTCVRPAGLLARNVGQAIGEPVPDDPRRLSS